VSSLDSLTDGELLALVAQAPDAFALFYRRHVAGVLAYFRRRTGEAELALDLTAETFARALEAAPRFRAGGEPAAAWLYSIARHLLTDSYRRGRVEDDARRRLGMQPLALTDDGYERIESISEARERVESLGAAGLISGDEAEALHARVVEERSYEEIARALECSPQVVRKRVSRGLRALKRRSMEATANE
jgi:RNA polymerase sigma factor (sigma-70 family)